MGSFLCDALAARPLQIDVIVPVPLSPGRSRKRGFNQAALLAEHVSRNLGQTLLLNALTRQERPPQSALKAADRLKNLSEAFAVADVEAVRGRHVLIVDDVVTTGTTVSACADTLARAGARRISVLAFARDL